MKVIVTAYDETWPALFEEEAKKIKQILGSHCKAIHHIGSTAVKGLKSKPIIDIMPVTDNIAEIDNYNPAFEALGYECMGAFGIPGRRYFRKGGDDRTHQIHIFEEENQKDIQRHLALRDYLRTHPEEAVAYGALKEKLAACFPNDIEAYCDEKNSFVKELEQKAMVWARLRVK